MKYNFNLLNRNSLLAAVLLAIIWLTLWFAPWQVWLAPFLWFRLSIALIIFIIPGACIYGLIKNTPSSGLNYLTFGFVISHLVLALLGTLARLLHLSFETLSHGTMTFSLIVLLYFALIKPGTIPFRLNFSTLRNLLTSWPLVLMLYLAVLMSIQRVIGDDDLSYIGYLTNWQHSPALDFKDIFFGVDKLASIRFWIISTPFSQAFLAKLSGLTGIFLLGGYYEPILVVLSLLSVYELAHVLTTSRAKSMLAAGFHLVFMALLSEYLHPGNLFLASLSNDKATAAYLFMPVFVQSIVWYLEKPIKENIILVSLIGLSLMIMHPVILVFGVMVTGLMTLFGINQTNVRARIGLLILLVMIMLPQVALRFMSTEAQGVIPYSPEDVLASRGIDSTVSVWGNTNFYGYNPAILGMHIPYAENIPGLPFFWLIVPIFTALIAAKSIRRDPLSQYIMACFLLAALAWFPLTGWILGSIVSAWMLERTLWIYPYGLGMVLALTAFGEMTGMTPRIQRWLHPLQAWTKTDSTYWTLTALTVLSAAILLVFMREQNLPNWERFAANNKRYNEFSQTGALMDQSTERFIFAAGTDRLNDFIPAISAKAKLISFRPSDASYPYFYSPEERNQRLLDRQSIFSRDVPIESRLALIHKYQIQFLWVKEGEYYTVKDIISDYPDKFIPHQFGAYILVEVR